MTMRLTDVARHTVHIHVISLASALTMRRYQLNLLFVGFLIKFNRPLKHATPVTVGSCNKDTMNIKAYFKHYQMDPLIFHNHKRKGEFC